MIDRLLVVSNGHGEDAIGALLVAEFVRQRAAGSVVALPLVGEGRAYEAIGVDVLGPRKRMPSDGFTLHHPLLAWRDLRAGLLSSTFAQMRALRACRVDATIVVGDVYAQAMAALVPARRVVMQPLVSVRLADGGGGVAWNRTFMERIRAPERSLMRARAERIYTRDDATATWLRAMGVAQAVFLGNPMMDGLAGRPLPTLEGLPVVALLPGTRAHAPESARRMASALALVRPLFALVAGTHAPPESLEGWSAAEVDVDGVVAAWERGESRIWWVRGRFADVLATADAVLGTSGTAQEQAAGLGLPVVAFPLPPVYTPAFLANQRRLLGDALRVVPNDAESIAAAIGAALGEGTHREAARREGPARMGPPGGTSRIVADVVATMERSPFSASR